jgi:hypothetical protein
VNAKSQIMSCGLSYLRHGCLLNYTLTASRKKDLALSADALYLEVSEGKHSCECAFVRLPHALNLTGSLAVL